MDELKVAMQVVDAAGRNRGATAITDSVITPVRAVMIGRSGFRPHGLTEGLGLLARLCRQQRPCTGKGD
jgi:hypothetical protein